VTPPTPGGEGPGTGGGGGGGVPPVPGTPGTSTSGGGSASTPPVLDASNPAIAVLNQTNQVVPPAGPPSGGRAASPTTLPGLLLPLKNTAESLTTVVPPPAPPAPGSPAAVVVEQAQGPLSAAVPGMAAATSTLFSPPELNLPSIPGVGIPLPNKISLPTDLICEGTAWSATVTDADGAPVTPTQLPADRRDPAVGNRGDW